MQTDFLSNQKIRISALLLIILLLISGTFYLGHKYKTQKIMGDISLASPLSLNRIFASEHPSFDQIPQDRIRTLVTTGDVMLGRYINYQTTKSGRFTFPFEQTASLLKNANLTFINLEGPLIENCPTITEGMIFCGDIRNGQGLSFAGIDVANLANNHAADYGQQGITNTLKALGEAGVQTVGLGKTEIKEVRGIRFAFLGYNDIGRQVGITSAQQEIILADIQKAKQQADVAIVAFHWGQEYSHKPTTRQKNLAHFAIDAGADIIVGNHPHWVQSIEIYRDKVIVYSHGNFVFDQFRSQKTQEGIVGKFTFYDKQLIDAEFLPIKINSKGQPYFLSGTQKKAYLKNLQ